MTPLLSRHRRPSSDDNLIPMINVVFLLLIFFMVASRIEAPANAQLQPPNAHTDVVLPEAPLVLELDRDGRLSSNASLISLEQLADQLANQGPGLALTLRADKSLTAADLEPVLTVLRKAGLAKVTLVTRRDAA